MAGVDSPGPVVAVARGPIFTPRLGRELGAVAAVVAAAVGLIAAVRGPLWDTEKAVKEKRDVYVLPPPAELKVLVLGYEAAAADLLWAHVMVDQGIHTNQNRRFENLGLYYDAIHALDPTWRRPYMLADSLFTLQTVVPPTSDILKVREILERGVAARPLDAELWKELGYFVTFAAPPTFLDQVDPELAKKWREDGTKYLERAMELSGGDADLGWGAVTAGSALWRRGDLKNTVAFYRKALAVTDDPELRSYIQKQLAAVLKQANELGSAADPEIERALKSVYSPYWPYFTKSRALLFGPPRHPAACAGPGHGGDETCAPTWLEWAKLHGGDPWLDEP